MFVKNECTRNKICPCSLGVALGVAEAIFMLLFAWAGHFWHYGTPIIHQIAILYHGYAPTLEGGVYGALWGFLDGFVFGMIVGLVYNFCIGRCCVKTTLCENKDAKK